MRLLLTSADQVLRLTIEKIAKEHDLDLQWAADPAKTFRLWEETLPDILIVELQKEEYDILSVIRKIRANETEKYTFIILLVESDGAPLLEEIFEAGVDDYLVAPVETKDLAYRVKAGKRIALLFEKRLVIDALAELAEVRDIETGGHLERISRYTRILAESLKKKADCRHQITRRMIENIGISSTLHDIGKVGIDDKILKKAGRYSHKEREAMKRHTMIGFEAIQSIQRKYPSVQFLKMAAEIALWHHEHFDGSGYPDGLKGEEIPLSARIVALADVYDALVSERIYKKKMTHDQARTILIEESGHHFDPCIVEAFLSSESEFKNLAYEFTSGV